MNVFGAAHLNDIGNYFIALVHLATIYRRSPEAARAMQRLAWEVASREEDERKPNKGGREKAK